MNSTLDVPINIVGLFGEARDRSMTGSQLRAVLKFRYPEFNPTRYGCSNLRDYIRQHVPEVKEIGRAGMDYVYALEGRPGELQQAENPPSTTGELTDATAVWRTFSNPRTTYRLYGDPITGKLIVVPPGGEAPGNSWREVPHFSAERHLQVAKEFLATIPNESASRLKASFDASEWWLPFFYEARQLGLAGHWSTFRRARILEQMKAALTEVGIPTTHVPEAPALTPPVRRPLVARSAGNLTTVDQGTIRLRRIAAALIKNMSATELRELPVRLGDVLDVLET